MQLSLKLRFAALLTAQVQLARQAHSQVKLGNEGKDDRPRA